MPVTRNEKIAGGVFAGVLATVALAGAFVASDDGTPDDAPQLEALAVGEVTFEETFASPTAFADRFDHGFSGHTPTVRQHHGDHNTACEGPTTSRQVNILGSGFSLNTEQLFWHCAPAGPDTGHLMTALDTTGYNIAWFSPKPTFTAVSKVCWDINETDIAVRHWTQVLFVGEADAVRYPVGMVTYPAFPPNGVTRGSGGFDLGFTSPDFRDPNGPTTRIHPQGGTLAGLKMEMNAPSWFQDQDTWTARNFGAAIFGITDKASRYTHCLENMPNNVVRLTQAIPGGSRVFNAPGQIPQHPVRVVFQDDSYDGPASANYDPNRVTWHWDNLQIFTASGVPPTTTTTIPASTTTAPTSTTTSSTSSTQPTSTSSPATTTTLPGTTTTTPTTSPNVEVPRADLEALLASLEQLIAAIQALLEG